MDRHETALRDDPAARAELDGLKAFVARTRKDGQAVIVPVTRLEGILGGVVGHGAPRGIFGTKIRPSVAAVAAVLMILVSWAVLRPPVIVGETLPTVDLRKSAFVARNSISDPVQAAVWAQKTNGKSAPVVSLASLGVQLTGEECGGCWVAYGLRFKGEDFVLYARQESGAFKGLKAASCGTNAIYEVHNGTGWYGPGGMTYILTGGSHGARTELAQNACQEIREVIR